MKFVYLSLFLSIVMFSCKSYLPRVSTVVVKKNKENYNSIRDLMMLLDANEDCRYRIIIPKGRYFEYDIIGSEYIELVGEDKDSTIIYCDGSSTKLTPSDYSFPDYANKPLNQINNNFKHIINSINSINISNLTLLANDAKYCIHYDNANNKFLNVNNCVLKDNNGLNFLLGIGVYGGQNINIENCEFLRADSSNIAVFIHNWNNQAMGTVSKFENCKFNSQYILLDELGSDNDDIISFNNCTNTTVMYKKVAYMVDITGFGTTYYINPLTLQREKDPTKLPYNIKFIYKGTQIDEFYYLNFNGLDGNPRPQFMEKSVVSK